MTPPITGAMIDPMLWIADDSPNASPTSAGLTDFPGVEVVGDVDKTLWLTVFWMPIAKHRMRPHTSKGPNRSDARHDLLPRSPPRPSRFRGAA